MATWSYQQNHHWFAGRLLPFELDCPLADPLLDDLPEELPDDDCPDDDD